MKIGKKNLWIMFIVLCIAFVGVIQVVRHFFREEERRIRTQIREAVKKEYPEAFDQLKTMYGLQPFERSKTSGKPDAQTPAVILVHGLDEPGKIWMNLAPALAREGFSV